MYDCNQVTVTEEHQGKHIAEYIKLSEYDYLSYINYKKNTKKFLTGLRPSQCIGHF